jgi:hypothetical protein
MSKLAELYAVFRTTGFPSMGREVGDFSLYDGLLAGCADRAVRGESVAATEIPSPDSGTASAVSRLRQKTDRSDEENAFLRYYELLEQIRELLLESTCS